MSGPAIPSVSLQDIRLALTRHKGRALAVFALVMIVTVAAVAVFPRKYRSEGKLFVRPSLQHVTKDPTALKEQSIQFSQSQEIEINSIVEILRSKAMFGKVVDSVGADVILGNDEGRVKSERQRLADRNNAIKELDKRLEVYSPKLSTVVDVQYDAASPELAQQIVAALLDGYLEEHLQVNRTDGSYEFFAQQTELLREQLEQQTEALRDEKSRVGVASIKTKQVALESQIDNIELQRVATATQLATSEAMVASLNRQFEDTPAVVQTSEVTGFANVAADGIQQQLALLKGRREELRAIRTDDHHEVVAVSAQIEELEKLLSGEEKRRTQVTIGANPARQKLEIDLLSERTRLASLGAQSNKLESQLASALEQLRALNVAEVRIAELQRDVDLTEESYLSYANKLEQARVHNELETKRISNVSVVQPATLESKPVSPNNAIMLALGFLVGTVGALAAAVGSEMFDHTLRGREQVEQELDLPVLMSIPRTSSRGALLN